jgi:hypothetical protein
MQIEYPHYIGGAYLQLLKILSLNELQQWPQAAIEYKLFLTQYTNLDTSAANLYKNLPKLKNENTAQWLSTFLPGAGQLYAGKPFEGLTSIVLQGAAAYFCIASLEQKYYFSAWFIGLGLFGSFHNGGVRRAEVLVQQYNKKKIIGFNDQVKEQLINSLK